MSINTVNIPELTEALNKLLSYSPSHLVTIDSAEDVQALITAMKTLDGKMATALKELAPLTDSARIVTDTK